MPATDPIATALAEGLLRYHGGMPRRIGVAVSGGGDSTALLLAAREGLGQIDLRAATVDHSLRDGAAEEARWVAALCASTGIPHDTLTLGLPPGPGAPARARAARYPALETWGRCHDLDAVLLGHTRDDVAETLLMRLRRGVGVDGLAAMPGRWTGPGGQVFARPFLHQSRDALRDWLRGRGQDWLEDPTNEDTRLERAELRQTMAALGLDAGLLARSATHLRDASTAIGAQARQLAAAAVAVDRGDVLLDRGALPKGPDGVEPTRRLWRGILAWVGDGPPRGSALVELLGNLPAPGRSRTLSGCRISAEGDTHLRIARELAACPDAGPAGDVWDRRWQAEGPDAGAEMSALGNDIAQTPWRETGLPRASLMAAPAIRRGGRLIAAPLAGLSEGWTIRRVGPDLPDILRDGGASFVEP